MKDQNYATSATSEKREILESSSFLQRTLQWIRIRKLLDPQEEQKKRIRRLLSGKE